MIKIIPGWVSGPGTSAASIRATLSETAVEQIQDPHNFMLEIWANAGLFRAGRAAPALIVFQADLRLPWSRNDPARRGQCRRPASAADSQPWSSISAAWRASFGLAYWAWQQMNPDVILIEGPLRRRAGFGLWFPAFALFFHLPWSGALENVGVDRRRDRAAC